MQMVNCEILKINGSYGEGGGQIVRTSLALGALTGKSVRIENIRAARKNPGLQAQHLTSVRAVATVTEAELKGAEVKSQELDFLPRNLRSGDFTFNVSDVYASAGATSLIFQTILPPLCFVKSKSQVELLGGTHVPWSPSFHYLDLIFLPTVLKMGVNSQIHLKKAGWYPKGGGKIKAEINPVEELRGINLEERGDLKRIYCISGISNLPLHIAERQRDRTASVLKRAGFEPEIEIKNLDSLGKGTIVFIAAEFENSLGGFTALGEIGKRAEEVAEEACREFFYFIRSGAAIEEHLADQIVLYMALAKGKSAFSTSKISQHLLTNIWVIEKFLPVKFQLQGQLGEKGEVSVEGIGWRAA